MRRIRPDARVILMSGYSEHAVATQFAGQQPLGFLQKPFRLAELQEMLRPALDATPSCSRPE